MSRAETNTDMENKKIGKSVMQMAWIFMVLASLPTLAQQNFASISFGTSLPLDPYRSTQDLASSGYANTGGVIKFDAGYFPVSYFGIGGSFSFGSNFAMRDSLLQDMIQYIEQNAPSFLDIPEDADILYGSGFWNYINLFLGPHFSIRASRRLYFDFRGLAGLSVLRPPDQELTITFDDTEIFSHMSKNRLSLGFTAGTGVRIKLNEGIALKVGVDYFRCRSSFKYNYDLFRGEDEDIPTLESEFLVKTIELSAGLAYSF